MTHTPKKQTKPNTKPLAPEAAPVKVSRRQLWRGVVSHVAQSWQNQATREPAQATTDLSPQGAKLPWVVSIGASLTSRSVDRRGHVLNLESWPGDWSAIAAQARTPRIRLLIAPAPQKRQALKDLPPTNHAVWLNPGPTFKSPCPCLLMFSIADVAAGQITPMDILARQPRGSDLYIGDISPQALADPKSPAGRRIAVLARNVI